MKLLRYQQGFTLIEFAVTLAVMAILGGIVTPSIIQTGRITTDASIVVTALEDIKNVARPMTPDVWSTQTSSLEEGDDPADSLTLDWTSWYDSSNNISEKGYHCEYTLLPGGEVQRKYWSDYGGENEQIFTTTYGRYISDIGFSLHSVTGGGLYIKVTITSSPSDMEGSEESLTYYIYMHPMEEVPTT